MRVVVGCMRRHRLFFLFDRLNGFSHGHYLGSFGLLLFLHRRRLSFLFLSDKGRAVQTCEFPEVQMLGQLVLQSFTQIIGNALHASSMQILQCGLAVLVVASQDAGGKHILGMVLKIVVPDDVLVFG